MDHSAWDGCILCPGRAVFLVDSNQGCPAILLSAFACWEDYGAVITHIWAIYRGILDKPPLLQGASPVAASIMPFFEFVFYWCIILGVAFSWQKRKMENNGLNHLKETRMWANFLAIMGYVIMQCFRQAVRLIHC